ncbi:MAG: 4Fe-4S binding protein [Candidatus Omnitrophota bacterium]|nr:4Fe-4S binding protein [Candidatus Omnitrophota bacterium]MDZ4242230.1 4Fe-4S binding protein [Candidatus Omnitrophota bacterium]
MSDTHRFRKLVPVIDQELCTGCRTCAEMCSSGTIILQDGIAVVLHPEKCTSEGRCQEACPLGGMHMQWVVMDGDRTIGSWRVDSPDYPGFTD